MDKRQEYGRLLGEMMALQHPATRGPNGELDPISAGHEKAMLEAAQKLWDETQPKMRRRRPRPADFAKAVSFLPPETVSEIDAKWKALADKAIEDWDAKNKELGKQLGVLCKELMPVGGGKKVMVMASHVSTYRSQGWGAESYAQSAVDMNLEAFRECYPDIVFEKGELRWEDGERFGYCVQAMVLDAVIDGDLLTRRGADTPLDEVVRRCWKHGVNPRVYMPFLPHGFEERHGLDYFGNRVTKRVAPSS